MKYQINVPNMQCERCAERITRALDGVEIKHEINLSDKTVIVDGCEHCLKTAISELEDLGFTPSLK